MLDLIGFLVVLLLKEPILNAVLKVLMVNYNESDEYRDIMDDLQNKVKFKEAK